MRIAVVQRRDKTVGWLIFGAVLVLLLSLLSIFFHGDAFYLGSLEKLDNDDVRYINSARILLQEHKLVYYGNDSTIFIMPGLPLLLAGIMSVFGTDETAIYAFRIIQAIFQSISFVLVFLIAREVFDSRTARLASIISAFYLPEYFVVGTILTECTFKVLFLWLVYLSILAVKTKKMGYYVIGGVVWAIACYFRPPIALYPAVVFLLWLYHRYSWKEILTYTCVTTIIFVMCMSPWWIRNDLVFDRFIVFTESSGSPFLLGAHVLYNAPEGFVETHPDYKRVMDEGVDQQQREMGKEMMIYGFTHEPFTYLYWYTIGKTIMLWIKPFYWIPIFGVPIPAMIVLHFLLMVVALSSVLSSLFRKEMNTLPLLLTIAYSTLIYLPFITFERYGYPLMPLFLMFIAHFIETRVRKKRKERIRIGQG